MRRAIAAAGVVALAAAVVVPLSLLRVETDTVFVGENPRVILVIAEALGLIAAAVVVLSAWVFAIAWCIRELWGRS